MKRNIKYLIITFFVIAAGAALLIYPKIINKGIINGLLMCGNVLIPALFPFCVLSVFALKSGILGVFKGKFGKITAVFIISLIGGYPVGAKLINDEYLNGLFDKNTAKYMLCFCVNAGPAFIYTFAGIGVMQSKTAGIILLAAHILSSVFIFLILIITKKINYNEVTEIRQKKSSIASVFVESVAMASTTLISICSFTVIFSGILELARHFNISATVASLLEITNGVINTKNIYFMSFLLGFSGLCVITQVYSVCNKLCSIAFILLTRVIHGVISTLNTFVFVKIFSYNISVFSNAGSFNFNAVGRTTDYSFWLLITSIIFLISLSDKRYSGKVLKDAILS